MTKKNLIEWYFNKKGIQNNKLYKCLLKKKRNNLIDFINNSLNEKIFKHDT